VKKLRTYFRYLWEYLKHGDLVSIANSVSYLLFRKSHRKDRIIRSSIGTFYCRKKTNDFQYANYKYEWGVKRYLIENRDYCILLARYNKRCFAFEPVIVNFNILNKNVGLNKLTNKVVSFPFGLGSRDETAGFVFDPVNTGASHLARNGEAVNCTVEIRTLDSVFHQLSIEPEEPVLLKLDMEGMEPDAIRGAEKFLSLYKNITLVIENKEVGQEPIKSALNKIANFEYGIVDEFNIFAKKIITQSTN
jgi:FkbM family methyltransferase